MSVTRNKWLNRSATEPKEWWQRAIAGERLPNPVFRRPRCEGTVEDHRNIALDVRELIRKHVFEQPVGSAFCLQLRFPWLRLLRLNSSSLDLELVTGRTIVVPLVWASCGVMGERMRLGCPLCGRRVCALYLEPRLACRQCIADHRNFFKVEKWTKDGRVERTLYAGSNLDKARKIFSAAVKHRPRIRLTIRQRTRVLQWPR
jgi:hypothetical protein